MVGLDAEVVWVEEERLCGVILFPSILSFDFFFFLLVNVFFPFSLFLFFGDD